MQRVDIFALDYDAILTAMYALPTSADRAGHLCVPPDPGIEPAALAAGEAAALGASISPAPGTGAAAALGASESASSGAAAPSGTLSGLYLPSFSTNLVSGADLQDAGVHQFTPASQRVTHCSDARTGQHLATFTRRPGSSLYTLTTASPPVPASGQVAASGQVFAAASSMASRVLVSGLPRSLPPLPPGPGPTCVPSVEGRQRAAPHSSQFPPTEAPLQTLHMDVWGLARVRGQGHERYFLLVVDDYSRYTTVFPLRSKGDVTEVSTFSQGLHAGDLPSLAVDGEGWRCVCVRVWGSRAFVSDLSADKLSPRAAPCIFLGFPPDAPGWQFYHPTSRRVLSSQDVTFDESVPYYRLFPYRTPSLPPPPLFLVSGPPSVDPLPPQGPAPSGVSQVDAVEPVEVAGDSGAAEGAEPGGADFGGADSGGAERVGTTTRGAEPGGAESGGAEPRGATRGGAEPGGTEPGGATPGGAEPEGAGPARGASGSAEPGGSPGASSRREPLSHRSCVSGLPGAGGELLELEVLRVQEVLLLLWVLVPRVPAVLVLGVLELLGLRILLERELLRVLARRLLLSVLEAVLQRVLLVLLEVLELEVLLVLVLPLGVLVLSLLVSTACPVTVTVTADLPLPAPSPYTGPTGGLAERREPASRPASPVRAARTSGRGSRQRPPPVPGTHRMSLRPSTAPLHAPLPSPPESSLPALADPESDSLRAASPTVTRLLATVVTDPSFESTVASALVAELVDFAARCRLDYAASLVAESESVCPPSVGDPDALDIPTPRSYAEAIEGPYSSQWQTAMDAEMASWKSTGTYVDAVPPPGANIVSGIQRQGVDYFQTFSPTLMKMTTLRVLLHVAAHRDYELHSLDFSTAFLQGSLHEEIWLRRPPGFTGSFPPGTYWSLRRPVYGLCQAPRESHDTPRTTLAALGFAPSTADPSLFLRIDTSLPPFYILVYVDDLVFATELAYVKSELQKRHTCTDLGELRSYLGLQITRDRARRTITLTQSHMVQQVLQRFGFTYSSPQATPLPTRHSLSALPSDESVESTGPYPELDGCLMYLMTCTRPDLAYPLS
ncbi:unnamed protein product [Closterium sp. NIES-65]|nr:unnamed protein product [Closterium sp. NIES-65]